MLAWIIAAHPQALGKDKDVYLLCLCLNRHITKIPSFSMSVLWCSAGGLYCCGLASHGQH